MDEEGSMRTSGLAVVIAAALCATPLVAQTQLPSREDIQRVERDDDGVVTRAEWQGSREIFRQVDRNHDNVLSGAEVWENWDDQIGLGNRPSASGSARNRQGTTAARSAAYRAGHERGQIDGRSAGREDRDRNQGWDLEGQRELERADSGYEARVGSRTEYQAGYRDGFRAGYPQGYDRQ